MTGDVQVLGLCRFSYPSQPGGFGDGEETVEQVRARLYAPGRLALRLAWFEHVALPSVARQADPGFTFLVMAGEGLPAAARGRLERLLAGVPQARLVAVPEGRVHRLAVREVMMAHRDPAARAVAEFRLDDDDAVGGDFVAQARARFGTLAPVFAETGKVTLDFCRGALLRAGPGGLELRPAQARLWTPGLVTYRRPDEPRSLVDAVHTQLWKLMPVLSQRDPFMWLRGAHETNASGLAERWRRLDGYRASPDELRRLARERCGLDLAAAEAAILAAGRGLSGQR